MTVLKTFLSSTYLIYFLLIKSFSCLAATQIGSDPMVILSLLITFSI